MITFDFIMNMIISRKKSMSFCYYIKGKIIKRVIIQVSFKIKTRLISFAMIAIKIKSADKEFIFLVSIVYRTKKINSLSADFILIAIIANDINRVLILK